MKIGKTLAAAVAIASLASTPALAGTVTRSSVALPTAQKAAPTTSQVRVATKSKKKSNQVETPIIVGVLAGGAIIGGVVAATSNSPESSVSGQQ